MIKKAMIAAITLAITGGAVISSAEDIKEEVITTMSSEYNSLLTKKHEFIAQTEILYNNIIAEKIRLEEERLRQIEEEKQRIIAENERKNSITFSSNNVTLISNISAIELYNVLEAFSGGSLAQYAWAIVDAEQIYNINAFFLTAIVAQESGWGKSSRAVNQNNLTGHAVYDSQAVGSNFNNAADSIYVTAELLSNNYVKEGGKHRTDLKQGTNGLSVKEINTKYCLTEDRTSPDYNWTTNIISIANSFVNRYHNNVKVLE